MILIKITKENREPKVGEWYYAPDAKFFGMATNEHNDYMYIVCNALSLSVIPDAPKAEFDDVSDYWRETDINRLTSYPISNSEEIFQWLHDQGKLGEEWVEWEGDHLFDWDDSVILRSTPCPAPLIRGVEYCGICEKDLESKTEINLFEEFIKGIDINNPRFENTTKVHDWRNYVPNDWQINWNKFTIRERKIIAVMAETQADKEEWD